MSEWMEDFRNFSIHKERIDKRECDILCGNIFSEGEARIGGNTGNLGECKTIPPDGQSLCITHFISDRSIFSPNDVITSGKISIKGNDPGPPSPL